MIHMNVDLFQDPAAFAAAATPTLMRDEAENCFWLGMLSSPSELAGALMCIVRSAEGVPLAVAIKTAGRQVVITRAAEETARYLARFLHERQMELPGVGGVRETAEAFAREWARLTGTTPHVHVVLALHRLRQLVPPPPTGDGGAIRAGKAGDVELLTQWIDAFATELNEPLGDPRAVAEKRVALGSIFLWEREAAPVAMAAFSGATPNGVRINLVYTPPPMRGRGYASNLVAALSRRLLDSGKRHCFLYTDVSNPTSNKIYRALGYEPVSEAVHITFDGAGGSH